MRIALVGLGAIGVSLARNLRSIGLETVGFSRRKVVSYDVVARGRAEAFELEVHDRVPDDLHRSFDLLIFALKGPVLVRTLDTYLPLLTRDGVILCAQNGIMEYFLSERLDPSRVLGSLVKGNAIAVPPNRIEIPQPVRIVVGPVAESPSGKARACLEIFRRTRFSRVTPSIIPYKWTKLVFSSLVNPLSAIAGLGADELLGTPVARRVGLEIIDEVIRVADKEGVRLGREGPVNPYWFRKGNSVPTSVKSLILKLFSFSLRGIRVSMLQDIELGRETEIDHISGFVRDRAAKYGVDVPYNELTIDLVKRLEEGELKMGLGNLESYGRLAMN